MRRTRPMPRLQTASDESLISRMSPTDPRIAVATLLRGARFASHAIFEALTALFDAKHRARISIEQEKPRSGLSLRISP